MNRRDFFKAFAAIGVSAALARTALAREHNIRLAGDFDGAVLAQFYVPGRSPVVLHYAMLRERSPALRKKILMTATGAPLTYEPEKIDEGALDAWEWE